MNARFERLLRSEREFAAGGGAVPIGALAVALSLGGAAHGLALGSYDLRAEQAFYSALKVPLLLGLSTLMCIPSFYALNAVLGLHRDFNAALRGVLCAQAVVAVVLASFAPVVLFFHASGVSYRGAILLDGALFCGASLAGQWTLARHYRPLIAANARHVWPRTAWLALYWFVTIQLAWVLRPFVGAPGMAPSFLREHAWSNAYVALANAIFGN
jgi:hypothetical protein